MHSSLIWTSQDKFFHLPIALAKFPRHFFLDLSSGRSLLPGSRARCNQRACGLLCFLLSIPARLISDATTERVHAGLVGRGPGTRSLVILGCGEWRRRWEQGDSCYGAWKWSWSSARFCVFVGFIQSNNQWPLCGVSRREVLRMRFDYTPLSMFKPDFDGKIDFQTIFKNRFLSLFSSTMLFSPLHVTFNASSHTHRSSETSPQPIPNFRRTDEKTVSWEFKNSGKERFIFSFGVCMWPVDAPSSICFRRFSRVFRSSTFSVRFSDASEEFEGTQESTWV